MTTQEHESKEIQLAIANGWTDIHGGGSEGGAYWRGINPENKRVEKLPAEYTPPNNGANHRKPTVAHTSKVLSSCGKRILY